jgi:multiple sugar transport system ATP-binding protein
MSTLRFANVSKLYEAGSEAAVSDVDLQIDDGEFFVLLGPSGCGKSTLLKMVAGFEEPTSGAIFLDDDMVNYQPPGNRNVAMVFQNYALYPHMTVRQNVAFPLRMRHVKREDADRLVAEVAEMLELGALLERPVSQLSGGQRQRVALGRALVRQPRVMLMDEPLSNLDALLRQQTREEILRLHEETPGTIVYVTHDQLEAMTMGDRIGVMNKGRLVQVGAPSEVYRRPADRFVAGFLGSPPMNFVEGRIVDKAGDVAFVSPGLSVHLGPSASMNGSTTPDGGAMTLGVRPEALVLGVLESSQDHGWSVELVENLGAEQLVVLRCGDDRIKVRVDARLTVRRGDAVSVTLAAADAHFFDASGARVDVRPGPAKSVKGDAVAR